MHLKQIVLMAFLLTPLALVATGASADEKHEHDHDYRQQGAHVHGSAALNLALEGREVHVELASPAADIVGFEHAPASAADHAALDKAVAALKDGDRLFRFNAAAGCRMEEAWVVSALLEKQHEREGRHSDEHAPGEKGKHAYEGAAHSDIEATYHFECDEPGKLTQLNVELFDGFPGAQSLKVQFVIGNKQGAVELTAADHVVDF